MTGVQTCALPISLISSLTAIQPFGCITNVLPEGAYTIAQSTISLHGAMSNTTCNRFTVGLFLEGDGRLSLQSKVPLLFSPNSAEGLPVGLMFFFGMVSVGDRHLKVGNPFC